MQIDFKEIYNYSSKDQIKKKNKLKKKLYFIFIFCLISYATGMLTGYLISGNNYKSIAKTAKNEKDIKKSIDILKVSNNLANKKKQTNIKNNITKTDHIKNTESLQSKKTKKSNNNAKYYILVEKYDSEKEALFYGYQLKKLNLKAKIFLTRSKNKINLYIGNIEDVVHAKKIMQMITKITEFQNSTLYKNLSEKT